MLWFGVFLVVVAIIAAWIISQYYIPKWQTNPFSFAGIDIKLPQFGNTVQTKDSYAVHITSSDFDEILRQANIPNIENIVTTITPERIELNGSSTTAIKAHVFIAFKPVINKSGDLTLEVNEVTVGGIRIMLLMNDAVRSQISDGIVNYTKDRFSGKITKIELKSGEIVAWVTQESK